MNPKIPQVSTRQFDLFRVTPSDCGHFNVLVNDDAVMQHFGFSQSTIEQSEEYLFKAMMEDAQRLNFTHRISLKTVDSFLGFVRMNRINKAFLERSFKSINVDDFYERIGYFQNIFDIDYAVQANIRGRGIMKEVLPNILEFLKKQGCDCVVARVNKVANKSSVKLLLNNGFSATIPLIGSQGMEELRIKGTLEHVNPEF